MTRKSKYLYLVFLPLLLLSSCFGADKGRLKWKVTLKREDKKPYGTYLAYHSLKYFFPRAKLVDLSSGFRYNNITRKMAGGQRKSLLVAVGLNFYLSEQELQTLMDFAAAGNEVVVFSRLLDDKMERATGYSMKDNGYEEARLTKENNGSVSLKALTLINRVDTFGYQGHSVLASFVRLEDSAVTQKAVDAEETVKLSVEPDTLGYVKGNPDFIRFKVGKGHISLHSAPLVLSNYFLLQQNNKDYLQSLWNTLPSDIGTIYWNDYFKRSAEASDLGVLLKYPATRWAFILALFALLVYILFESKRRQRIIPEIKPLENSSASFVETVGRLYYHEADHTNLGEKMIQHFLEWVRTYYFINTNKLDQRFAEQLTVKSGLPVSVVTSLMEAIREIHIERKKIDEKELYHLYHTIDLFYKTVKADGSTATNNR
jgi:hypothetical protein